MFPTAGATVYVNEAGEPLGWSDESSNDPYDPDDVYFDNEGDFDDYDPDDDPDDLLLDKDDDGIIDLEWDASSRSFRMPA
jgi:hypothetical protein